MIVACCLPLELAHYIYTLLYPPARGYGHEKLLWIAQTVTLSTGFGRFRTNMCLNFSWILEISMRHFIWKLNQDWQFWNSCSQVRGIGDSLFLFGWQCFEQWGYTMLQKCLLKGKLFVGFSHIYLKYVKGLAKNICFWMSGWGVKFHFCFFYLLYGKFICYLYTFPWLLYS